MSASSQYRKFTEVEIRKAVNDSYSFAGVIRSLGCQSVSGTLYNIVKDRVREYGIPTDHFVKSAPPTQVSRVKLDADAILQVTTKRVKTRLLRRALMEKGVAHQCSVCGQLPEWMGRPLVLQIDHLNGDSRDNTLSNLRFLCLHCHSQTETFGAKSLKGRQKTIRLQQACEQCGGLFDKKEDQRFCSVSCVGKTAKKTKIQWPNIEQLTSMMWAKPGREVAIDLGVSWTALKKRCSRLGILRPTQGFWNKKAH